MKGILGRKIGMTQLYAEGGKLMPVTLIEAGPCAVLQIAESPKDKYRSIKLGFDDRKESRTNKADLGNFKKAKSKPKRFVREIRFEPKDEYVVGEEIKADIFDAGEFVDVTGVSKGKGFQGGMKRWHWKGGPKSHGSTSHRRPGSIGASSFPSRVLKGHHMPGHLGAEKVTTQNLEILKVDKERNILVVKGTVPGHNNSYVTVSSARKMPGIKANTGSNSGHL